VRFPARLPTTRGHIDQTGVETAASDRWADKGKTKNSDAASRWWKSFSYQSKDSVCMWLYANLGYCCRAFEKLLVIHACVEHAFSSGFFIRSP
jgi:hypothetical protein